MSYESAAEGCALTVLATAAVMVVLLASCSTGWKWGRDVVMEDVACPSLLAHAPTLVDSLAIATEHTQCEWWHKEEEE